MVKQVHGVHLRPNSCMFIYNNKKSQNDWEGVVMPQTPHWLQWGASHLPQNYIFPRINLQTQLPASFLDPSNLLFQTASIYDQLVCHNAPDR